MRNTRIVNIGDRFTRLEVLGKSEKRDRSRSFYYSCKCDCGKIIEVRKDSLFNGRVKSCGCYTKDRMTKHNLSNSRLYHIRGGMLARCYNKSNKDFHNYGARGISVCEEWKNSFEVFYNWAITNGYSDNLSIDRIDVNGNYEPSNCRWTTNKQQSRNTRKNHFYTYKGETKTITEWAEIKGIRRDTLTYRIKHNWAEENIFD
jgi:hypothetical protein